MARRSSRRSDHRTPWCQNALEVLESRVLLSAGTPDAGLLADGFVQTTWLGQDVYAKPGQWILEFRGITGDGPGQLARINGLLAQVTQDVHATVYLGASGLVLAESPKEEAKNHWTYQPLQARLQHLPEFVELNPNLALKTTVTFPNDPGFPNEWGLHNTGQTGGTPDADIDAPEAWDITRGDGSVVVGVVDSGIDYTHPDLAANIWTNPGEIAGNGIDDDGNGYIDDVHGWDFANNDNDPMDDAGHGTHVAGTIAAEGNNGIGVTGVNWNNKLVALKFITSSGSGTTSAAIAAINYATDMRNRGINIRVLNNSWGGSGSDSLLQQAIVNTGNAGILFVAAAGNNGTSNDTTPVYPAAYHLSNELVVAATDQNDQLASFSNYGSATVDLAAPGVNIYSTLMGGSYGYMSGTSMATPHVSGVAALAWSAFPNATMASVRQAILAGVDPLASLSGKVVTGGRLNAYNTLLQLNATPPPPTPTVPAAPTNLTATALSSTQVRLTWVDNATNETGYQVQQSLDGINWTTVVTTGPVSGSGSTVSLTISNLSPNTLYYYRVAAVNDVGLSDFSNIVTVQTLTGKRPKH